MNNFQVKIETGVADAKKHEQCLANVDSMQARFDGLLKNHPLAAESILGIELNKNADGSIRRTLHGFVEGWNGRVDADLHRISNRTFNEQRKYCARNKQIK